MKWYEDKFRRHLCDMHIDDWSEEFLSEFSAENYFAMLKKAKVQMAMIYLQSHLGLCNWQSKTAKTHAYFDKHPQEIRRIIDMCRADGIKVMGYYSLNFNRVAYDAHKEWSMLGADGLSDAERWSNDRKGLCCPNNLEYREFVYRQIDEMLDEYEVDGLFFDMLYWPQVCYCDACKERYKKETGKDTLPLQASATQNEWIEFADIRAKWLSDWAQSVTDYVKSRDKNLVVEHNFSSAASPSPWGCCRDGVSEASDFAGGDLYGGALEQSFVCKMYRSLSKNQPFEYMTGRCTPNLLTHTVSKTEDSLMRHVMLTCAHHGASLMIDAIDPVGTLDERVYALIGKCFGEEEKYEPYLNGEMVADIGIFYNLDSKFNLQNMNGSAEQFLHFNINQLHLTNHTASLSAMKTLVGEHIPNAITTKGRKSDWENYKVIVAPNINRLENETVDALIEYVKNGGNLYFNNCDETRLFETLIGGKYIGHTKGMKPYMFPKESCEDYIPGFNNKYPLPLSFSAPMVEGVDEEYIKGYLKFPYTTRMERRCASFHSDPPGIDTKYPAIIDKPFGNGRVIWCAGSPELYEAKAYRDMFISIISKLYGSDFTLSSTAPQNIELVSFKEDNKLRISAVNLTEGDILYVCPDFSVTVKTEKNVTAVKLLPDKKEIPFKAEGDMITFTVSGLKIMEMFEIETE